jgi:hypothetical protein
MLALLHTRINTLTMLRIWLSNQFIHIWSLNLYPILKPIPVWCLYTATWIHDATFQKTAVLIVTAMKISHITTFAIKSYIVWCITPCRPVPQLTIQLWLDYLALYCFCDLTYPISMYWSMGWIKMKWNEISRKIQPFINPL